MGLGGSKLPGRPRLATPVVTRAISTRAQASANAERAGFGANRSKGRL